MIEIGKSCSVFEFRDAYINNPKLAQEYEMWLNETSTFKDNWDRTNIEIASKKHQKNIINGLLFQTLWFKYSKDFYNLKEVQKCDLIDSNMQKFVKKCPDFVKIETLETFELKFTDKPKFKLNKSILCNAENQKIEPIQMHNSDYVIICYLQNERISEIVCKKENECYIMKYITNSDRLDRIYDEFKNLIVK